MRIAPLIIRFVLLSLLQHLLLLLQSTTTTTTSSSSIVATAFTFVINNNKTQQQEKQQQRLQTTTTTTTTTLYVTTSVNGKNNNNSNNSPYTSTVEDNNNNVIINGNNNDDDKFVLDSFEQIHPDSIVVPVVDQYQPTTTSTTSSSSTSITEGSTTTSSTIFPMDLIVGHGLIKQALMIIAVLSGNNNSNSANSLIISGSTGTGKSILIQSIQRLFHDNNIQVVHVPVTASEDALTGSIDLEKSLQTGIPVFQDGILSKANNNSILLLDDTNLMDENSASVLYKALSDGYVKVEREGLSIKYPCKPYMILGTYNNNYEELRTHFLDRYAIHVTTEIDTPLSTPNRIETVLNNEAFIDQRNEKQKDRLHNAYEQEEKRIQKIQNAKAILSKVQMKYEQLLYICQQASIWDCEGQRGELSAYYVAKASAALDGRTNVNSNDIELSIKLCIIPRARCIPQSQPLDEQQQSQQSQQQAQQQQQQPSTLQPLPPTPEMRQGMEQQQPDQEEEEPDERPEMEEHEEDDQPQDSVEEDDEEKEDFEEEIIIPEIFHFGIDKSIQMVDPSTLLIFKKIGRKGKKGGKRSNKFNIDHGKFVKSIFPKEIHHGRIAVGATLRAAAPYQLVRKEKYKKKKLQLQQQNNNKKKQQKPRAVYITKDDFRIQLLKKKTGNLIIFVVDASGSMALNRMSAAKGAAMMLLNEAYKSRDKIALISFHGQAAEVVVPPTKSMALTSSRLEAMPCGSKTPMADALVKAVRTGLNAMKVKQDSGKVIIIIISDCRPNVPLCESAGEVFDPSIDKLSKNGQPSRQYLKDEVLAIGKQIGSMTDNIDVLVIDTEDQFVGTGVGAELAHVTQGNYYHLARDEKSKFITNVVKEAATTKR